MEFRFVPLQCPRLTYKCVGLSIDQSNYIKHNPSDVYFDKQPKIIISSNGDWLNFHQQNRHHLDNNRYSCTSLKTRLSYTDDSASESSSFKGHSSKPLTMPNNGVPECDISELIAETNLDLLKRKPKNGKPNANTIEPGCGNKNRFSENGFQRPFPTSSLPFKATIYRPVNLLDVDVYSKKRKRISDTTCVRLNHENIQRWLLEHGIRSRLRSFSSSNFYHRHSGASFVEQGAIKTSLGHATSKSHDGRLHEPCSCRGSLVIAERLRLAAVPTPFNNKLRHSLRMEKSVISLLSHRLSNGRPISDVVHDQQRRLLSNHQLTDVRERNSDPVCHTWRAKKSVDSNKEEYDESCVLSEQKSDSACHTQRTLKPTYDNKEEKNEIVNRENILISNKRTNCLTTSSDQTQRTIDSGFENSQQIVSTAADHSGDGGMNKNWHKKLKSPLIEMKVVLGLSQSNCSAPGGPNKSAAAPDGNKVVFIVYGF